MYKILIDSTDRYKKSVKLIKYEDGQNEVISEKNGEIDIVQTIAQILTENNLKPSDIEDYTAKQGPGSFTGLKIGFTIANVLNWALKKKNIKNLDYPDYGREPNIQKNPSA